RVDFARSLLPIFPAQAMLASLGMGALAARLEGRRIGWIAALLVPLMAGHGTHRTLEEHRALERSAAARLAAMEWFVTNVSPGTRVAAEWFGPPFNQWPSPVRHAVKTQPLACTGGLRTLIEGGYEYVVESGMYELLLNNPASSDPADPRSLIRR